MLAGQKLLDEHAAGIARTDDHDTFTGGFILPLCGDRVEETDEAVEKAHAGMQHEAQAIADDVVGSWHVHVHEEGTGYVKNEEHEVRADHVEKFNEACEIPDAVVETEHVKDGDRRDDKVRHGDQIAVEIVRWDLREIEIEPEEQAQKIGEKDDARIGKHQKTCMKNPGLLERVLHARVLCLHAMLLFDIVLFVLFTHTFSFLFGSFSVSGWICADPFGVRTVFVWFFRMSGTSLIFHPCCDTRRCRCMQSS